MKNQIQKTVASLFAVLLLSFSAFAQDGKLLDIDIDLGKPKWYEQPIVWVGVALFLLILVLLNRKSK
jgi:hypothetical protein